MATAHFYHNAHNYFVELPLTYGGSLSCAPGKYVKGDSAGTFARSADLGILTDDGTGDTGISLGDTGVTTIPAGLYSNYSLLIFTEGAGPYSTRGDTGSGLKGDTGTSDVPGDTGATGPAGAKGDTGAKGNKGDTGVA